MFKCFWASLFVILTVNHVDFTSCEIPAERVTEFEFDAPFYRDEPLDHLVLSQPLSFVKGRFQEVGLTFSTKEQRKKKGKHYYWVNFVDTNVYNFEKKNTVQFGPKSSTSSQPTKSLRQAIVNHSRKSATGDCVYYSFLNWVEYFWVQPFSYNNMVEMNYSDPNNYYSSPLICNVLIEVDCNTDYAYQIVGDDHVYEFRTTVCEDSQEVDVVVVADLGQTAHSYNTMKMIEQSVDDGASLFLFPGDIAYADGFESLWDSYAILAQKTFSTKVGVIYSGGDHEIYAGESNVRYNTQYNPSGDLFQSYNVGPMHVISLDSYDAFNHTPYEMSRQYVWLERDLALANQERSIRPWIVAMWHVPWYNTNQVHYMEGEMMRQQLEKLLYDNGVDFVISGHVHSYERSKPSYNLKPTVPDAEGVNCGITYVNVGDGGNREGAAPWYLGVGNAPYRAYCEAAFGHGRFKILNATHLEWYWYRNMGLEKPSQLGDTLTLVRPADRSKCIKK